MNRTKNLISIVVPVYNEEDNVAICYSAVKSELDKITDRYDYEFVFTDNCSTDKTFQLLAEIAEKDPRVKVARFSKNFGYQKSIFTGYCLAAGAAAIEMDADLQDPPQLIHEFIGQWEKGFQVVFGIRRSRQESWWKAKIRKVFYRWINFLSSEDLPLNAGDFRLVDRVILDQLRQLYDATPYLRGTIATLGFRQIGIPYDRAPRIRGKGKFSIPQLFALALDGILNHSVVPLRVATFTGFAFSGGLLFYFLVLSILTVFFDVPWPKGFATLTILILISISLNALFLGIIGEYLGRIYKQIKAQALVVIDQTLNLDKQKTRSQIPKP
ncbi:MAG: glycosyltransferase family 2 protein [Candidatus Omnitrophota bacterium]